MFGILNSMTMVGFQHLLWHVLTNDKSRIDLWEDNCLKCHFYQSTQLKDKDSKFTNILPNSRNILSLILLMTNIGM